MKTLFIRPIAAISVGLLLLLALPTYGGGAHGGGAGGHAGFGGGAHFSGGSRGYSAAGSGRPAGMYFSRFYSSRMSTGRYSSYRESGQRVYRPRISTERNSYDSNVRPQSRANQAIPSRGYSRSDYVPRHQPADGSVQKSDARSRYDPGTNQDMRQHHGVTDGKRETPHRSTWSQLNQINKQKLEPQTTERLRSSKGKAPEWKDANRNHNDHWRDRHHHDRDWWRHHSDVIVLVGWGFWGWYDSWWYPAWGYDPYYSYYEYNGPIYSYDRLRPDEVIANVQAALQQLGYHPYAVDGVLGPLTQAAIANYQRDYGLSVTGAIDPPTVRSLGLET